MTARASPVEVAAHRSDPEAKYILNRPIGRALAPCAIADVSAGCTPDGQAISDTDWLGGVIASTSFRSSSQANV
jgi:hypothetical protein